MADRLFKLKGFDPLLGLRTSAMLSYPSTDMADRLKFNAKKFAPTFGLHHSAWQKFHASLRDPLAGLNSSVAENTTPSVVHQQSDTQAPILQPPTQRYYQQHQQDADYLQMEQFHLRSDLTRRPTTEQLASFMPTMVPRKAKTSTPEVHKDDRYWEKRKRNNVSAKRSRENKRMMGNEVVYKASYLEEQNAILRKKISVIKNHHGLPLDESVMTPAEHEQCMIEIRSIPPIAEQDLRKDTYRYVVSSTSPCISQLPVDHMMETSLDDEQETTASSGVSENEKGESPSFNYGPATYGPFNPSPSWAPVSMQPSYGSSLVQNYPPRAGQSKRSTVASEFQEKSNVAHNYITKRGISDVIPPPYGDYMQYRSQGQQMHFRACSDGGRNSDVAPADLSMGSSKRHKEQRGVFAGSSSGAESMRNSKIGGLHTSVTQTFPSTPNYMGDAAAKASSSGHVQGQCSGPFKVPLPVASTSYGYNPQEMIAPTGGQGNFRNSEEAKASSSGQVLSQFCEPFKVPLPVASTSTSYNPPEVTAPTDGQGSLECSEEERIRREIEALQRNVRNLQAKMERIKDQQHTNETSQ